LVFFFPLVTPSSFFRTRRYYPFPVESLPGLIRCRLPLWTLLGLIQGFFFPQVRPRTPLPPLSYRLHAFFCDPQLSFSLPRAPQVCQLDLPLSFVKSFSLLRILSHPFFFAFTDVLLCGYTETSILRRENIASAAPPFNRPFLFYWKPFLLSSLYSLSLSSRTPLSGYPHVVPPSLDVPFSLLLELQISSFATFSLLPEGNYSFAAFFLLINKSPIVFFLEALDLSLAPPAFPLKRRRLLPQDIEPHENSGKINSSQTPFCRLF